MDELSRVRDDIHKWSAHFQNAHSDLAIGSSSEDKDFSTFVLDLERDGVSDAKGGVELLAVLDDFCDVYRRATQEKRTQIRELVASSHSVLVWLDYYSKITISRFKRTHEAKWLERSLVAQSMIDQRLDFREIYMSLGAFYIIARRLNIDPDPYFRAVAGLSSAKINRSVQLSTKRLLSDFVLLPFFNEVVLPKLW